MVREAQDALTINRYDMDFRLVQDVTELEQFSGGFPEGGADRYVFGFDARQAVNFSVQPMNAHS